MEPQNTFECLSNAKVNLGLRVLGKRSDGYHDIESVFVPISLSDILRFTPAPELTLTCSVSLGIRAEENLVWRAVKELETFSSTPLTYAIELVKQIPSGAGLGGGSSNAAFTLLSLNRIAGLNLTQPQLLKIAERLGSDVPFFLYNCPCYVTGRGENIQAIGTHVFPYGMLLLVSDLHVATSSAYGWLGRGSNQMAKSGLDSVFLQSMSNADYLTMLGNDFEESVVERFPALANVRQALVGSGAIHVTMSGSGSSFLGIYPDEAHAARAQTELTDFRTVLVHAKGDYAK